MKKLFLLFSFLLYDSVAALGQIPGGGMISTVTNTDGTLTIATTLDSVIASLNRAHANTWSAAQTFADGSTLSSTGFTASAGAALTPSITGVGATTTGLYWTTVPQMLVAVNGAFVASFATSLLTMNGGVESSTSGNYYIRNVTPSATAPTYLPNNTDTKAGLGAYTAGGISFIVDNSGTATEVLRGTTTGTITIPVALTNSGIASSAQADVVCTTSAGLFSYQVSATGCVASSIRFKQNVREINNAAALQTVLNLRPKSYNYRPETNMGSDIHFGFIAEQVERVDRNLITYENDGRPHAVKYNELWPFMTGSIQELYTQLATLQNRVEILEKVNTWP